MAEKQTNQELVVSKEKQAEAILRQRTQDFLVHTDAQVEPSMDADEKTKNDYKLARDRAAAVKGFLGSSNGGLAKNIEGVIDNQQVLEGLPVEGVIEYLDQEQLKLENVLGGKQAASQLAQKADRNIDIKEPPLTDEQTVALESYRKLMSDRASIYGHSESYFPNIPVPRSEGRVAQKGTDAFYYNEGTPAHRRILLEAKVLGEDPTRASQAGTEEERQRENFQKGIDAMDARRMYRYAEAKSTKQEVVEQPITQIDEKEKERKPARKRSPREPKQARGDLKQIATGDQAPANDADNEAADRAAKEATKKKLDDEAAAPATKREEDEKRPFDPSRAVVPYPRNTDVMPIVPPKKEPDAAPSGQDPANPSREVAPYVAPITAVPAIPNRQNGVVVPPRDGNDDAIDAEWRPVHEGPVRIDGNQVTKPPQLGSGNDLPASQQIIDGDYRVLDDKTERIVQPKRLQLEPPAATSGEQPPNADAKKDKDVKEPDEKQPGIDVDKDKKITELTAEVDALKKRLDELERKMAEKDAEINRLKKNNERLQRELDEEKRKNKAPAAPVAKAEPTPLAEAASFVVGIDNQNEDIEKRAREMASERLRGLQNEKKGNILKRALNGARYKIFGEAYRQKYIREARSLMVQHGTTAVEVTAAHTFSLASADVIKRFQSDREAAASRLGLIEESQGLAGGAQEKWQLATGDTRTFLMDKVFRGAVSGAFANEAALQKHLTDLMKQVSDGTLVVSDQVKKDLTAMFGKDQNMSGKTSEAFASNILTMAEKVKASAEFKNKGLDAVAERVKFVIGKSAWAAQTEASYNAFDKTLMKMNKSRIGRVFGNHYMFTAATVGAMTVITKSVLGRGANLIFPVVGGAVVGGAVAGLQKGFELRTDRLTHQAEMAYGRQYEPGAKNREKMDQYIYSMATVGELLGGGGSDPRGGPRLSIDQLTSADLSNEENKRALMTRVAEIQGRMDFSIQNKVDLIKYEHRESVAQGRLELTRALVRARKALEASGTPTEQLTRPAIEAQLGVSFDDLFTNEKKAKDQTFNHYVRGEVAKRALVAAGLGIGVGTAIGFARENGLFDAAAKAIKDAEIGALRGIDQGLKSAGIDTSGIKAAAHAVIDAKNTVLHGAREVAAAISPSAKIGEIQVGQHLEGFFDKGPRAIGNFMGELKGNDLHLSVAGQPDTVLHLVNGKIDLAGQTKAVVDALKQSGFNVTETSHVNTVFDNLSKTFTTENVGGIPVKTPDGLKWIADARGGFNLVDKTDPTKVIMKGVNFVKDAQGTWTVNHADIVGFPGQNAQVLSETLPGVPKSVDILGANGEWAKHSEKLAKIDWYANNTQYSDHNELRAYTYKLGKKIIIDMSKMQAGGSFQNGLPSVDVPSVVKNGKAAFSFFLPGLKEPIIIPSPLDGKLILDPDDMKTMVKFPNGTEMPLGKLTQMLIDEKEVAKIAGDGDIATEVYGRQSIFKLAGVGGKGMGVMSVGRLVKNAAGESEWHSFAALRGSGVTDGTIDMPSTDTMPRIEIPKLATEVKDVFAGAPPNVEVADKLKIPIGYTPIPFLTNPLENLKDEAYIPVDKGGIGKKDKEEREVDMKIDLHDEKEEIHPKDEREDGAVENEGEPPSSSALNEIQKNILHSGIDAEKKKMLLKNIDGPILQPAREKGYGVEQNREVINKLISGLLPYLNGLDKDAIAKLGEAVDGSSLAPEIILTINAALEKLKVTNKDSARNALVRILLNCPEAKKSIEEAMESDKSGRLVELLVLTIMNTVNVENKVRISLERRKSISTPENKDQSQEISFGQDRWAKNERPTGYVRTTATMDRLVTVSGRASRAYLGDKYQGREEGTIMEDFWKLVRKAQTIGLTETEASRVAELSVRVKKIAEDEVRALEGKNDTTTPISGEKYNELSARWNQMMVKLRTTGNQAIITSLGSAPIGKILNGPHSGGDTPEARAAYHQISHRLDEIEQTLNTAAAKVELSPVYSNPEKGKPIESAIVSAPRVRFIPDVHGGSDKTKAEGRSPLAPFRANSVEGEILVSLGDIADRGPQSWEAAQELKGMVEKGEAIHVLGNHDMFAIAALLPAVNGNTDRQKTAFANWLANGGTVTVRGATGIDVDAAIQSEMARQNVNRDTILRNLAFGGDAGSLINVFDKVRQDKGLLDWAKHMQQHGKMYAVANGGMAVHAGVPVNPDGSLLSVKVNGKDLSGLDYLDAIQASVRSGDANTILGLNNGDKTDMNNFMWVREPYQNVIANRNAAHNMREALNQQVGARGGKVEFLVHGHDRHKGGTGFQTTSTNQDRVFFIDTSHSDGGEPAALMASLSLDGKKIDVAFKNPETNASPKNEAGRSINMEEGYELDQALPVPKKKLDSTPPAQTEQAAAKIKHADSSEVAFGRAESDAAVAIAKYIKGEIGSEQAIDMIMKVPTGKDVDDLARQKVKEFMREIRIHEENEDPSFDPATIARTSRKLFAYQLMIDHLEGKPIRGRKDPNYLRADANQPAVVQAEAKVVTPKTTETPVPASDRATLNNQDILMAMEGVRPEQGREQLLAKVKDTLDKSKTGVDLKLAATEIRILFEAFLLPMLEANLKSKGVEKLDVSGVTIKSLADGTYAVEGIKVAGVKSVGPMKVPWNDRISISMKPQPDGLPQIMKLNHDDDVAGFAGTSIDAEITKAGGIAGLNEKLQTPNLLGLLAQVGINATGVGAAVTPSGELTFSLKK